jgi:hypothetical protein
MTAECGSALDRQVHFERLNISVDGDRGTYASGRPAQALDRAFELARALFDDGDAEGREKTRAGPLRGPREWI